VRSSSAARTREHPEIEWNGDVTTSTFWKYGQFIGLH